MQALSCPDGFRSFGFSGVVCSMSPTSRDLQPFRCHRNGSPPLAAFLSGSAHTYLKAHRTLLTGDLCSVRGLLPFSLPTSTRRLCPDFSQVDPLGLACPPLPRAGDLVTQRCEQGPRCLADRLCDLAVVHLSVERSRAGSSSAGNPPDLNPVTGSAAGLRLTLHSVFPDLSVGTPHPRSHHLCLHLPSIVPDSCKCEVTELREVKATFVTKLFFLVASLSSLNQLVFFLKAVQLKLSSKS